MNAFGDVFFDCDSTLSAIEGINELAGNRADVRALTADAMAGRRPLESVYALRLEMIRPSLADLARVAGLYIERLVTDAADVVAALHALGKVVHIVSGGLRLAIEPLAHLLGVPPARLHAVGLFFDAAGGYRSFERDCPLAHAGGKVQVITALRRPGVRAVLIGDGATDLEAAPAVDLFVGFGGVIAQPLVREHAGAWIAAPSLAPLLPLILLPDEQARLDADPAFASLMRRARGWTAPSKEAQP